MMRRWLFGVAIAVLVAGSVTFAQDRGRTVKYGDTMGMEGQPMGPCGGAVILTSWVVAATFNDRYDNAGTLIQTVASFRTIGRSVYFLAASVDNPEPLGDRIVMGVPGETQVERVVYAENRAYIQGSIYQATVPHYGRVFSETGRTVLALPNWTVVSDTGHAGFSDQDLAALCAYLSQ